MASALWLAQPEKATHVSDKAFIGQTSEKQANAEQARPVHTPAEIADATSSFEGSVSTGSKRVPNSGAVIKSTKTPPTSPLSLSLRRAPNDFAQGRRAAPVLTATDIFSAKASRVSMLKGYEAPEEPALVNSKARLAKQKDASDASEQISQAEFLPLVALKPLAWMPAEDLVVSSVEDQLPSGPTAITPKATWSLSLRASAATGRERRSYSAVQSDQQAYREDRERQEQLLPHLRAGLHLEAQRRQLLLRGGLELVKFREAFTPVASQTLRLRRDTFLNPRTGRNQVDQVIERVERQTEYFPSTTQLIPRVGVGYRQRIGRWSAAVVGDAGYAFTVQRTAYRLAEDGAVSSDPGWIASQPGFELGASVDVDVQLTSRLSAGAQLSYRRLGERSGRLDPLGSTHSLVEFGASLRVQL